MAAQLGMGRDQLLEVGLGALLQDSGMLRVPEEIRLAARPLTDEEWFEVRCHPLYTLEHLEQIRGLPRTVACIAYQLHERVDGRGYPRERSGLFVHPYAKIAGIADAYAAMIRPRPHRPPISPYLAAKTVLIEGSSNKFDRTMVRAFLDAVSLFPVGSRVELDDGSKATTMRANPGQHTRPVVELMDDSCRPTGRIMDLSREKRRSVNLVLPIP
jgi:HD-GYP domain-containing protein (c-di-GMP phosphodiesterase class II)